MGFGVAPDRHPPATPMNQFALLTATALLLAGCETPRHSRTWETVKAVRHTGPFVQEPASAYAEKLHATLQGASVPHKVVTFKFRYHSRLLLSREGEETAVIYRDCATPAQPSWLMSERLSSPVWLPRKPLESQVAFYLSRPVSIVKVEDFPANAARHARKHKHSGNDGKTLLKPFRPGKKAKHSHRLT